MDQIEQALCELLGNTMPFDVAVTPATDLLDDLALASAQVMELIMAVEDHFEIILEQEVLADVRTVGQLADVVRSALR